MVIITQKITIEQTETIHIKRTLTFSLW